MFFSNKLQDLDWFIGHREVWLNPNCIMTELALISLRFRWVSLQSDKAQFSLFSMSPAQRSAVKPDGVAPRRWHDLKCKSQGFPLTFCPNAPERKIDSFDRWYFSKDFVSQRVADWLSCGVFAIKSVLKLSVLLSRIKITHGNFSGAKGPDRQAQAEADTSPWNTICIFTVGLSHLTCCCVKKDNVTHARKQDRDGFTGGFH